MLFGMLKMVLIGCGKMGGALLSNWQSANLLTQSYVVDPYADGSQQDENVTFLKEASDIPQGYVPDVLVIAVKPQLFAEVITDYRDWIAQHHPLLISIMAGRTMASIEEKAGEAAIIRTMPNLPTMIGQGVTALLANARVSDAQKTSATQLFEAAGEALWVKKESDLDDITAISGSGPGFVFHFLECYINAAKKLGFSDEQSRLLVYQTVLGSTQMALQSTQDAAELREAVTSKNGTTQAGLEVLMQDLSALMEATTQATKKRSLELA